MKFNTIKRAGRSEFVNMGPIQLRQPIPAQDIEMVDPFILLHHYGPYQIDEKNNPFDLGPHPHRGFEPITFLIQGEQLHRDSLGHESVVRSGDVQWTTAGRGIIHSEGPTKEFVQKGGTLEGIQLWLNLPAEKKMIQPNYQHVKKDDFNVNISENGKVKIQVVAGNLEGKSGKIATQTSVNAFLIDVEEGGETRFTDLTGDNGGVSIDVQPKKGRALIWPNVLDGDLLKMDKRTYHEALPLIKGRKFGANAWFYLRKFQDDNCEYDTFESLDESEDAPDHEEPIVEQSLEMLGEL